MKIKRFVDSDMRQVLRRVREDQGPDAVILSNRRVDDGIEVIAAVDYDEALIQHALGSGAERPAQDSAPDRTAADVEPEPENSSNPASDGAASDRDSLAGVGERRPTENVEVVSSRLAPGPADGELSTPDADLSSPIAAASAELRSLQCEVSHMRGMLETQLSRLLWKETRNSTPARAQILSNLTQVGVAPDIASLIANRIGPIDDPRKLWRTPLLELAQTLPVVDDDLLDRGGVAALVGPTGVGKTTTIAKLAFRHAMQHGADSVAMISADAHRIGAREQLATFANLLGVPVHAAEDHAEVMRLLERLDDKQLILIDTEGCSQRDVDLSARLAAWGSNDHRIQYYLTLAATCQEAGIDETLRAFDCLPLAGAVVTKIDEAAQLGCVIGALIRHDLRAAFFTDGQRVPDDLYPAARKRLWLVNQAVDCMRASKVRVAEEFLAEKFAQTGAAHA